jgi:hypothetical protein
MGHRSAQGVGTLIDASRPPPWLPSSTARRMSKLDLCPKVVESAVILIRAGLRSLTFLPRPCVRRGHSSGGQDSYRTRGSHEGVVNRLVAARQTPVARRKTQIRAKSPSQIKRWLIIEADQFRVQRVKLPAVHRSLYADRATRAFTASPSRRDRSPGWWRSPLGIARPRSTGL